MPNWMLQPEYQKHRKRGNPYAVPFDEEVLHNRKEYPVRNGQDEASNDI